MTYHIVWRGYTCVDGTNTLDRRISPGVGRHSGVSGGCCSLLFGRLLGVAHPLQKMSQQIMSGHRPRRREFVVCSRRSTCQGCLLYLLLMLRMLVSMKKELTADRPCGCGLWTVVGCGRWLLPHSFLHTYKKMNWMRRVSVGWLTFEFEWSKRQYKQWKFYVSMTVFYVSVTGATYPRIPQLCESNLSFVYNPCTFT